MTLEEKVEAALMPSVLHLRHYISDIGEAITACGLIYSSYEAFIEAQIPHYEEVVSCRACRGWD